MTLSKSDHGNSVLCCGLDPDLSKLPAKYLDSDDIRSAVLDFLCVIVDLTAQYVSAYKLQKAFFDLLPDSKQILIDLIGYIRRRHPSALVILDAKAGDIDNTMLAYLQLFFTQLAVDNVVLNPLMGADVWASLSHFPTRSAFVLVRTSNLSSALTQEIPLLDGRPYWRHLLDIVMMEFHNGANLWPIISSTAELDSKTANDLAFSKIPLFIAGIGAQGGSYKFLRSLTAVTAPIYVNSSRALIYCYNPNSSSWREAIANSARTMSIDLREALGRA